jgi:hypothetical protein
MALEYGYATGSLYDANRYSLINELLVPLQDNTNNAIVAQFVRDAVFTLWERVGEVSNIANNAASMSATFMNASAVPTTIGGVMEGTTFPTEQTVQQMFDLLLYPYVPPTISLSLVTSEREYGQSVVFPVNWSVTKKSKSILSVTITDTIGINNVTSGSDSQSGVFNVTGTYSNISTPATTTNTFTMNVQDDGGSPVNTTATLTWKNKMYWGSIDLNTLLGYSPNLTLNPSLAMSVVGPLITETRVKNLLYKQLSTSKSRTINNLDGAGNYLIFAWPSSYSGATTPIFTLNGLPNSAFSMVRTAWTFTNSYGFTTNYEVWVSNTEYNSPVTTIILS